MAFLQSAYLPRKCVTLAIGDVREENMKIIKPFKEEALLPSMQYHADLSICFLAPLTAVCSPESFEYYKKALEKTGVSLIAGSRFVGSTYPFDAAYNVAILGKRIFCRKDITDEVLLRCAEDIGYEIIDIRQGYAKCSVCPIDENSAISADLSFYRAAVRAGIDVLYITNENIKLGGFPNGFFGGCAYKTSSEELVINGDATLLPDFERIKEFSEKHGVKLLWKKGEVYDFGSFIPICEE